MKIRYSEKKKIPIIELPNDVVINLTADDPIRYIYFKVKIREKGIVETIRDLVVPTKVKTSLKKKIKANIDKKTLDALAKAFKKYAKKQEIPRENLDDLMKEIEKI